MWTFLERKNFFHHSKNNLQIIFCVCEICISKILTFWVMHIILMIFWTLFFYKVNFFFGKAFKIHVTSVFHYSISLFQFIACRNQIQKQNYQWYWTSQVLSTTMYSTLDDQMLSTSLLLQFKWYTWHCIRQWWTWNHIWNKSK